MSINMSLSSKGYLEIATDEGLCLRPYDDGTGVITIGFGTTASDIPDLNSWDKSKYITTEQAITYFKQSMQRYENAVNYHLINPVYQYQFDALVSICYNIGCYGLENSSFLRDINNHEPASTIKAAMLLWDRPSMILGRRRREANLYTQGVYTSDGFVEYLDTDGDGHQLKSTARQMYVGDQF